MITPELNGYSREEQLIDNLFTPIFNELDLKEKATEWARNIAEEHNRLPKRTIGQIKETKKLIRQAAGELLQNPQDIGMAGLVWKRQKSFYTLVKEESKTLIRERWKKITPEQLAELVRIYTNNPQAKDFAKEMLTNYFSRPKTSRQRINAHYTFVSSLLDLVGEDEAFLEGMKIALYATDILPRDPGFIEQVHLLSLPSKEEEKGGDFQKLLITESVIKQAIFMSSQDFTEYLQGNKNFMRTNKIIKEWYERKKRVTAERGSNEARGMNDKIMAAMNFFSNVSKEPLSEEKKQALMGTWPFNLAFDETDPLNQKFQKVSAERKNSSTAQV